MRVQFTTTILVIAFITIMGAQALGQDALSVQNGAYTEKQAARGMKVYEKTCLVCHPIEEYVGIFLDGWAGVTALTLVDSIAETMPLDSPGGLKDQEFYDMVAYIFQANGLPPGETKMDGKTAEQILIEGPFGEARGDSESQEGAKPQ